MKLHEIIFELALVLVILSNSGCSSENDPTQKNHITIFTIGDSTMANKKPEEFPETGWAQVLHNFVDDSVTVYNYAKGGRSTKSFISEGLWEKTISDIQDNDYLFIQFGHNDEKKEKEHLYAAPYSLYKDNLEMFVKEAIKKGARPILFTPIARRVFNKNGDLEDTHGEYVSAVKELSKESKVLLVDMNTLTTDFVNKLGVEESKDIYMWVEPSVNFPEGREDNTHLSEKGAREFAKLVLMELSRFDNSIKNHSKLETHE